ncbi:MAG TPA: ABC transporter [Planctomycetota bacterium]
MDWKQLLVLQFPGASIGDFDRLVALEDKIGKALGSTAAVDGHDFGSGEGNLFLLANDAAAVFRDVLRLLDDRARADLRAAWRDVGGDTFTILWPSGLTSFRVL